MSDSLSRADLISDLMEYRRSLMRMSPHVFDRPGLRLVTQVLRSVGAAEGIVLPPSRIYPTTGTERKRYCLDVLDRLKQSLEVGTT